MSEKTTHDPFKLRTAPDGSPNVRFVGHHYHDGFKRDYGYFPGTDFCFADVCFERDTEDEEEDEAQEGGEPRPERWSVILRGLCLTESSIAQRDGEPGWWTTAPSGFYETRNDAMRETARFLLENADIGVVGKL